VSQPGCSIPVGGGGVWHAVSKVKEVIAVNQHFYYAPIDLVHEFIHLLQEVVTVVRRALFWFISSEIVDGFPKQGGQGRRQT